MCTKIGQNKNQEDGNEKMEERPDVQPGISIPPSASSLPHQIGSFMLNSKAHINSTPLIKVQIRQSHVILRRGRIRTPYQCTAGARLRFLGFSAGSVLKHRPITSRVVPYCCMWLERWGSDCGFVYQDVNLWGLVLMLFLHSRRWLVCSLTTSCAEDAEGYANSLSG